MEKIDTFGKYAAADSQGSLVHLAQFDVRTGQMHMLETGKSVNIPHAPAVSTVTVPDTLLPLTTEKDIANGIRAIKTKEDMLETCGFSAL